MLIVMRTIVRLTALGRPLQFVSKRVGPFLPREIPLLREFHRDCKRLRLPWFCKHGTFLVTRQTRQGVELARGCKCRLKRAQDSHPTYRGTQNREENPASPKAPVLQSRPNKRVAGFRRRGRHCCRRR